ncbi:MAG: MotA/TolQ/ExbB proton channel family protein [Peptococcaceae bacterium]|nr:MotA/TolQ/ExbB proton channel family protein [Peptococcaceae bacterium]
MRKPVLFTNVGIIIGAGAVLMAVFSGGGASVFLDRESFMITVLGSFAALLINYSWDEITQSFFEIRALLKLEIPDPVQTIEDFGALAVRARREGLLVLEDEIPKMDPFLGKGLQMIIDGMDSAAVSKVLEIELVQVEGRHQTCSGLLTVWSNLAPGFGMIGTLVGLVKMLNSLDDASTIGPSMAVALVTTFYGAIMANFILIPLAGKVNLRSQRVLLYREMIMEGLMALQAGVNPRVIEQRLRAFIVPQSDKASTRLKLEAADD